MDQNITILMVDDEQDIVDLMRDFLEAAGFKVLTALDGLAAINAVAAGSIDCVLLDLSSLMRSILVGLEPVATAKGITLMLRGPSKPVIVMGDEHLLTRAIENLVDNAVRYTPDGGMVTVTISRRPTSYQFAVADTGPGIPGDRLFTPLYRREDSRNRRTGGAGLRLTIARRILIAHGGSLTAANAKDGGALFTGTLPLPQNPQAT